MGGLTHLDQATGDRSHLARAETIAGAAIHTLVSAAGPIDVGHRLARPRDR